MLAAMILARRRRLADRLFESYVPRSDPSSLRRSPNPQFCEVRPPQPIAAIRDRHLHRSSRHSPLLTQPLLEQRAHLLNSGDQQGDQQGPPSARPPSTASKCNEEPQNRSKISHFLRIGPPPARPKREPSRRIPPPPPPHRPIRSTPPQNPNNQRTGGSRESESASHPCPGSAFSSMGGPSNNVAIHSPTPSELSRLTTTGHRPICRPCQTPSPRTPPPCEPRPKE